MSRLFSKLDSCYNADKKHKQADFAELVGLEVRTLQNYENGHSKPTFDCVKKIATALEMTVEELESYHERPVININKPKQQYRRQSRHRSVRRLGHQRADCGNEGADAPVGKTHRRVRGKG